MSDRNEALVRIGELSQRTGVSAELLRAWERRYGLLRPARSAGGFRLYSHADEARIERMKDYLGRGLAAAEAARLAVRVWTEAPATPRRSLELLRGDLARALDVFDEDAGHRVLDAAFDLYSIDSVISEILVPYLDDLGQRWARNEVSVAQEHFASNLLRGRLLALGRSWNAGYGPRALLACPEGEQHDLGIVLFGVALGLRGWRITFLGANTPLATVVSTARDVRPDAVVVAATDRAHLEGSEEVLTTIGGLSRLIVAGRGTHEIADTVGAELFDTDPVSGAERLASTEAWTH